MFNREVANKIDEMIMEKFPIIYDYKFDGILLIYGGVIRNTIMNLPVKDFDFVLLTSNEKQIMHFIRKFKIKFYRNAGGGYKILYNDFSIDMWSCDDLLDAAVYDTDMIFYDVEKRIFISCGALRSFENGVIREINSQKEPIYSNKLRLKKIIKFIEYYSNNKKQVKVKQSKLLWEYKMFIKIIKNNWNKIIKGNFVKCFRFLSGCKKELNLILILKFLMSIITLMFPLLMSKLLIEILSENYCSVGIIILLISLLKIIFNLFNYIYLKLKFRLNKQMKQNINKEVIKKILCFEIENTENDGQVTFASKLKSDSYEMADDFLKIIEFLSIFLSNMLLFIYVYCLSYKIGLVLLIITLIIFLIKMVGITKQRLSRGKYFYDIENCTGTLGDMFYNNVKNNVVDKNKNVEYYGNNLYDKLSGIIQEMAVLVIMLLGLFLVYEDSLDIFSFIIILMYNSSMFMFLDKFGLLMNSFSSLNMSCYRIFNLIDGNLYAKEIFGNKYKDKCNGMIEFNNVKFKYNNKLDYVLNECSFKINSNETVALVGKGGSGKTTILNLIARLYNVSDGVLKIDGVDINEYSEEFLRENISVISQNPYLFDMSINDNFRLVKEDITDDEIKDVCRLVYLSEFIETLPNKYDTIIGEGGVKLSGGQKQRLAIARALIKKTKIILLDDINYIDKDINEIIRKLKKNHTIVVVVEDDDVIDECDRKIVIKSKVN